MSKKSRSQTQAEATQKRKNEAFLAVKIQEWEAFNARLSAQGKASLSWEAYKMYAVQSDKW